MHQNGGTSECSNTAIVYKRPKVFRRYEDGYIVREMQPTDARIVQNWYCSMGTISPYDLDVALSVFPPGNGFYIGEINGVVIASAIRIPWSENVFYGSMYYVDENYRGSGYGTRLRDQVAREYVGGNILCVDAVEGQVAAKNKAKFGYEYGFKTSRYEGVARDNYDDLHNFDGQIIQISEANFEDVIAYDNKCFVTADNPIRRSFLKQWLYAPGGSCFVALNSSGHVVGYGRRNPCFQEDQNIIAPLYADSSEIAKTIFYYLCLEVAGQKVTINIWQPNQEAVKMMGTFGMTKLFDVDRMHVNGDPKEYKNCVFGVTSIDVCGF